VVPLTFSRLNPIDQCVADNGVRKLVKIGAVGTEHQSRCRSLIEVADQFVNAYIRQHSDQLADRERPAQEGRVAQHRDRRFAEFVKSLIENCPHAGGQFDSGVQLSSPRIRFREKPGNFTCKERVPIGSVKHCADRGFAQSRRLPGPDQLGGRLPGKTCQLDAGIPWLATQLRNGCR
jgi:hypothetical protein